MKCCAASSARAMPRLRGCAPRASSRRLAALELRLALGKEGSHALPEVLGVEAGVALVVFGFRKRPRIGEPAHELLVPARGKRRAVPLQIRRAHCDATSNPPPTQAPWMSATTG